MPKTGTCALCLSENSNLLDSHIIPEFFYKRVYTSSHKYTQISLEENSRLTIEQKGYREKLLCGNCEQKISKWEGKLSQFASQIISKSYTNIKAVQVGSVTLLTDVDYYSIKMAILSIFWRMSISTHNFFKNFELGSHEEKFRILLDKDLTPSTANYPVLISLGLIDQEIQSGLIHIIGRGRFDGGLIMQSAILNGIVFDCLISNENKTPNHIQDHALNSNGKVKINSLSLEKIISNMKELSTRVGKEDVKNFFDKHNK